MPTLQPPDRNATGPTEKPRANAIAGWMRRGRSGAVQSYRFLLSSWPIRGFNDAGAGHLSAILAYNGLVALVPTTLLLVSIAGLVLQRDAAMTTFVRAAYWALPTDDARQALEAALAARGKSGWLALASLGGFIWIGSGFAGALNHCFNCVYGVPDGNFIATRRRGIVVLSAFVALFTGVTIAATLPALFIQRDVGPYFSTWALAGVRGQIISFTLAYVAASIAFLFIYRLTPNASQRLRDVWPGAVVAGGLFVAIGQAFPLYLRLVGGVNRYGAAFGLLTLLVAWFAILAHILLFGCYVNVSYRRRRGSWPLEEGARRAEDIAREGADTAFQSSREG